MESMKIVRGQVSSIVDIDFFLNDYDLNAMHADDRIADIVRGAVYARTKQRINDFIARCEQTLAGLQDRVNQTDSEWNALVARARTEDPGSGPSDFWVDKKDPSSIAKYNAKVVKHNAQVDLHRRIIDQAHRAKERYEDAVDRYNEKKADLDEQVREKLEELKPALDQDILTLLGKMQQLAYDYTRNKNKFFEGFLLSYLAKKAYVFLYDRIDNTMQQKAATDIFRKLDEEIDAIVESNTSAIKEGLMQAGKFLSDCHETNSGFQKNIKDNLERLPYQTCTDTEAEVSQLLSLSTNTNFEFEHIIDPAELAKVEEKVKARKNEFVQNVRRIDDFSTRIDPTFADIASIREFSEGEFGRMVETKTGVLDPVRNDVFFAFGVFDEENQEQYLKKHKQWIQTAQTDIQSSLNVDLRNLVRTIIDTELLTKTTRQMLDTDQALKFFTNKQKIANLKQQLQAGIKALESMLQRINELPRQKAEEFTKKMSLLLNLSLLPLGNLGTLFPINEMVKKYLPAFTSSNSFYVELKQEHIKKFQTYSYIHIGATLASGIVAFLVQPPIAYVLAFLALTYAISTITLFMKASQLQKL